MKNDLRIFKDENFTGLVSVCFLYVTNYFLLNNDNCYIANWNKYPDRYIFSINTSKNK